MLLQTTVYDNAAYASLPVGSISAPVRTYDSYIVNPSLPTTASLPTGVARIVDGARKLFEVGEVEVLL